MPDAIHLDPVFEVAHPDKLFIGGEWTPSRSGERLTPISPITESPRARRKARGWWPAASDPAISIAAIHPADRRWQCRQFDGDRPGGDLRPGHQRRSL
jgi:hypothetical protein